MERKSSSKTRKDKEQKVLKVDHELNSSMAQTEPEQGRELTEEGDSSSSNPINRGKIKSIRKRKAGNLPDEDVIDGFLILSYGSVEELEADGPIKPGATIAKKARSSSPLLSVKKGKAKSVGKIKKNGVQEKNRKNKENTRDNILEADEKPKKKAKKIKLENATATKPEQAAIEVDSPDPERKKDVAVSPLHVSEITEELPTPLPASSPSVNVPVEQKAKGAKLFEKVTRPEEAPKALKTITPKKTLSDFSIRAIQGIDTTPTGDSGTKSIATMTSENSHDKSVSPPKPSDRVPLSSSQFYKGQERKISSVGNMIGSPSKHGFPFPEKPRESGHGGQFPRLKFTPSVSSASLHKIPLLQADDIAEVRQDRRSAPALSPDLLRQETHQHQHQHIHQHQHQHQHFHPPYGSMPGHPYAPMYYGPVSMMPVVPPGNHQAMPLHPVKKTGKWCALHVQIARFIAETQKKIEKFSIHKPDPTPSLTPSNRTGSHAFQAVQPRSHGHQERDLGHHFGGHFHSSLNALPNQHHSSPLHSFTARPPEKTGLLSHPLDPGHHMSSALRHGSNARGPDLPSFGFSGLSRPFDRVPEHDVIADRLSPFSRRPRLADLGLPPAADFVGLGRSSSQSSLFLRRDTDAKLERERSHHLTQTFLDREKPSLFRSSNFDLLDRASDLRPGAQSLGHSLPGSELKSMGSPPLSKAVTTTQNILRSMKLYEKNFGDRSADHQGLFHKEKSRDLGLFGSRPRIGGAVGHSGQIPNFGLGSSRPHLSSL